MSVRWPALFCVILLVGGCRTPPLEHIDETVADYISRPVDLAPPSGGNARTPARRRTPRRRPCIPQPGRDTPRLLRPPPHPVP